MFDLHCHTTFSDGIYSPSELIEKAVSEEIAFLAITDHDSVDALPDSSEAARGKPIRIISGCELSIEYPQGDFHLLGYGIKPTDEFVSELSALKSERESRVLLMIEDLNKNGYNISEEDLHLSRGFSSPGKPHVARALVSRGYASSIDDAFLNFMHAGKPGFIPKKKIKFEKAISLIIASGGIPVMAHPATLQLGEASFCSFLERCISSGLKGLEVYSPAHSPDDVFFYRKIAEKYSLYISAGSDFHGDHNEKLGCYQGERFPAEVEEGLYSWLLKK